MKTHCIVGHVRSFVSQFFIQKFWKVSIPVRLLCNYRSFQSNVSRSWERKHVYFNVYKLLYGMFIMKVIIFVEIFHCNKIFLFCCSIKQPGNGQLNSCRLDTIYKFTCTQYSSNYSLQVYKFYSEEIPQLIKELHTLTRNRYEINKQCKPGIWLGQVCEHVRTWNARQHLRCALFDDFLVLYHFVLRFF